MRATNGFLSGETGATGDMQTDYVFFDGRRIASLDSSGNVHYLFSDVLGSTRVATDAGGNVCFDADYYPYGHEVDQGTPTCAPEYRFAGMEYDAETGNYYDYARYYNPRLGRFMTPDPASAGAVGGNPQSWNAYSYVLNNPETLIDPTGRHCTPTAVSAALVGPITNQRDLISGTVSMFCTGDWRMIFDLMLGSRGIPRLHAQRPSPHWRPQTTGSKVMGVLSCAEGTANRYSIAGLLGVKDSGLLGAAAYAFGGNSISQILGVAGHIASGLQAASTGNGQGVAGAALQVQGDLMLGGTLQGVLTGGMGNPAAQGLVGTVMEGVFGAAADTLGTVKLGLDTAVFFGATAYCIGHSGG